MGLEVEFRDQGRGVIWKASGTLTGEEFVRKNAEILSRDFEAQPIYYSLFDADQVDAVRVSASDIREVAARAVAVSRQNPKLVSAVFAGSTVTFGLARMWEILVEQSGWKTNVFRDRSDAVAWLKKEVEASFGMKIDLE